MTFNNLVLSGGAFKASAFIGCIKFLQEQELHKSIKNVVSSSAGSIIAFFFCIGMTHKEMRSTMKKGIDLYTQKEVEIDDVLDIFDTLGIDDGKVFEDIGSEVLQKYFDKSDMTFIEFAKHTGMNLVIAGSNISQARTDFFSVDTYPEMSVLKAMRVSISIPFIMKPIIYKNNIYVDASLFNNFPIEYFSSTIPFKNTIALYLQCTFKSPTDPASLSLFSYIRLLIDSMFVKLNTKPILESKKNNIILEMEFPDDNYGFDMNTMKLVMDEKMLDNYLEYGYKSIREIFKQTK